MAGDEMDLELFCGGWLMREETARLVQRSIIFPLNKKSYKEKNREEEQERKGQHQWVSTFLDASERRRGGARANDNRLKDQEQRGGGLDHDCDHRGRTKRFSPSSCSCDSSFCAAA
jgi:hypothetical protein